MKYLRIVFFCILVFSFYSCCRSYVTLQEQWVDKEYLASFYVNTPDPELKCPPCGKNLLIEWNFPVSVFRQNLSIILTARLWDNTTRVYKHKITEKQGYVTMYFSFKNPNKKLLTYKVEVMNVKNELVENIENQFWAELIEAQ